MEKLADLAVESLRSLDTARMTDAWQDNKPRRGDRGVEGLGHVQRGTLILVAVQQQRRNVHARKHITQIRFGKRPRHGSEPGWMELDHGCWGGTRPGGRRCCPPR